MEKGAYLGAIASIATKDRTASPEETDFIETLCSEAGLSEEQKARVFAAMNDLSTEELQQCLDILKTSELRFSLIADIISFAKADGKYTPEEEKAVEHIAQYVNINREQFTLLDAFAEKATLEPKADNESLAAVPGFSAIREKLEKAGINVSSLTKGLLTIAGPLLLAKLLSGRRGRGMVAHTAGAGSLLGMLSGKGYPGLSNLIPSLMGKKIRY